MMAFSIRTRLTLWFTTVLFCGLLMLTLFLYWGLKRSIDFAADKELRAKLTAIATLMQNNIPTLPSDEVREEFGEHSSLGPGDLWQVRTEEGQWIFQSSAMQRYSIRIASLAISDPPRAETVVLHEKHTRVLRVLTTKVIIESKGYVVQVAADLSEFAELLDKLKWLSLITIPLTLLLASGGGYWLSSRALSPVLEITEETRLINATNLSRRLTLPVNEDELRTLSLTLNEMLDRIESSFHRVQEFSADASHELRTPIAVIRTTAELALRKERDLNSYRESLREILSESERTSAMIENLLTLARSDASPQIPLACVDLAAILRRCCEMVGPLAREKQLTNIVNVPNVPGFTMGNEDAVHRLFLLLLDNAIKYSSPQGRITTTLTQDRDHLTVVIEDNGMGISGEDIPHIFERFYRADKARTRDDGGSGLGLSIAQWIADAHQAEIQVTSKLGIGSVFRIHFPRQISS